MPYSKVRCLPGFVCSVTYSGQIVSSHLKSFVAFSKHDYATAFKHQSDSAEYEVGGAGLASASCCAHRSFFEWMNEDRETIWWMPAINAVLSQLRFSAYKVLQLHFVSVCFRKIG